MAPNELMLEETWSTDLCDCCGNAKDRRDGWSTCCLAMWCPCIQYGKNVARLRPGEAPCAGNFTGACLGFVGLAVVDVLLGQILTRVCNVGLPVSTICPLRIATRESIRKKYKIKGYYQVNCCSQDLAIGDYMAVYCCGACTLCQEHYHLTKESHMAAPTQVAYTTRPDAPGGMYTAVPQAEPTMTTPLVPAYGIPMSTQAPADATPTTGKAV